MGLQNLSINNFGKGVNFILIRKLKKMNNLTILFLIYVVKFCSTQNTETTPIPLSTTAPPPPPLRPFR